jgi:hypothetical protein
MPKMDEFEQNNADTNEKLMSRFSTSSNLDQDNWDVTTHLLTGDKKGVRCSLHHVDDNVPVVSFFFPHDKKLVIIEYQLTEYRNVKEYSGFLDYKNGAGASYAMSKGDGYGQFVGFNFKKDLLNDDLHHKDDSIFIFVWNFANCMHSGQALLKISESKGNEQAEYYFDAYGDACKAPSQFLTLARKTPTLN